MASNIHTMFINKSTSSGGWPQPVDFATIETMVSRENPPESVAAIGERLRLIRTAMGLKKAEWCRRTGISPQSWGHLEGTANAPARNRISLDQALIVARFSGAPLDYIYRGELMNQLPASLLNEIQRLQQDEKRKRA